MAQSASDKNTSNLVLESPDAADSIVAFYKKGLDGNGWKTESTMATAQLTMLTASKEQRQVVVQITDSGAKRNVMQVVSDK
jgi:outer membrane lipopolysaccharide assembly protein LptE/RlpB